jgi:SHNi-TPR
MEDEESRLKLGDVHIVLGDVSLESENFEVAIQVPFTYYRISRRRAKSRMKSFLLTTGSEPKHTTNLPWLLNTANKVKLRLKM